MEENKNTEQKKTGDESLLDKAKKLIGNADEIIEENVDKVIKSDAFKTVADTLDKAGSIIEDKIDELKNTDIKGKLDTLADKAEEQAEETLSKAKDLGKKLANKAADKLEDIAGNIRDKTKEDDKA